MSQEPHDLVAAYALDALDEDERERFEQHLDQCAECTEQLALLREPVAALAYAVEGPAPPEALRGRIIERALAEPRAAVLRMPRRNWPLAAVGGVGAVAACLAIGLGIWAHSLSSSLDRERSAKAAYDRVARILTTESTAKKLTGAAGSLVVARDGRAALVVCNVAGTSSSKTYEAWVISGNTPQPAGLFRGGSGCAPVLLTRMVPSGATVGVTLEPAGGSKAPTLPILFKAERT